MSKEDKIMAKRITTTKSVTIKTEEGVATIDTSCKWVSNNKEFETKLNTLSEPLVIRYSGFAHVFNGTNLLIVSNELLRIIGGEIINIKKGRMKAIEEVVM